MVSNYKRLIFTVFVMSLCLCLCHSNTSKYNHNNYINLREE